MYLNSNSMKVNNKNVNSNRSFGIVFFFVFLIIGLWPTFNGLEMFVYQGQKSFYMWNKINPEIDDELINLLITKLK